MHYFAYDLNMNRERMEKRCPGARFLYPAHLSSCELIFDGSSPHRSGATVNIRPAPLGKVWGALFEISERELLELDAYEGYPDTCLRTTVQVYDGTGASYEEVITYYRKGQAEGLPSYGYFNELLECARQCHLPSFYIQRLTARVMKNGFAKPS